ncbi:hypothetical protein V5F53_12210 [Xanthobacter sp. V4C-4]|uniref:hypothetical protein n=1 Tax=Xanthobacter cornucopiae TaxID=3119924 RepID=UPI003729857A
MLRRTLAVVALGTMTGLAACSSDGPLSLPVPPHADVPEVTHDSYPTVGAPARPGRQVLTEPQRARLQSDLERLSKEREAKVQAAIQSGN